MGDAVKVIGMVCSCLIGSEVTRDESLMREGREVCVERCSWNLTLHLGMELEALE